MTDVVILDAVRSAVGRAHKGSLAFKRPDELAGEVIRGLMARHKAIAPETIEDVLIGSIAPRRFTVFLLAVFAGSALVLALIGLYGVIAYSVAVRTREIGVRMALGADRYAVVLMVVRQGMTITIAGLAVGVVAGLALTRVMAGLLYDVAPNDPAIFAVAAGIVGATALAACCVPAFQAARVDPLVALRSN